MKEIYITERLILEVLKPEDAPLVTDYYIRNRVFLQPWEPKREYQFYTNEHHEQLLAMDQRSLKDGRGIRLWIFKKDEYKTRTIGCICLSNIIRGCFQSCFVGYKGDKDEVKKGYMKEALDKVVNIAFHEACLHRIEANIIPRNIPSIKLVKSLGFQYEGLGEKYLKINDVWEDHEHYSITSEKRGVTR